MREDKSNTLTTVAVLGGGAALAWYLWGKRGRGGGRGKADAPTGPAAPSGTPARCQVRIRERKIELNGAPADLPTTIAACLAAGGADVTATGTAIMGVVADTVRALEQAGVRVWTDDELRSGIDSPVVTRHQRAASPNVFGALAPELRPLAASTADARRAHHRERGSVA